MKVARVGTMVLPCTSFVQNQVPAQPLRSLDSATGGPPLRALRDGFEITHAPSCPMRAANSRPYRGLASLRAWGLLDAQFYR